MLGEARSGKSLLCSLLVDGSSIKGQPLHALRFRAAGGIQACAAEPSFYVVWDNPQYIVYDLPEFSEHPAVDAERYLKLVLELQKVQICILTCLQIAEAIMLTHSAAGGEHCRYHCSSQLQEPSHWSAGDHAGECSEAAWLSNHPEHYTVSQQCPLGPYW